MARITHRIRLRFCSLAGTFLPWKTMFNNAVAVYGQYGIRVDYAGGQSVQLSPVLQKRYDVVDGDCVWNITGGERAELQRTLGLTGTDITVVIVNKFATGEYGCGGHIVNYPVCMIQANALKWTMAHEIGHVLLTSLFNPVHDPSTHNLMYKYTSSITWALPILNVRQREQIKKSPYCLRV